MWRQGAVCRRLASRSCVAMQRGGTLSILTIHGGCNACNKEVLAVAAPGAGSSGCAVWGTARPHNGTILGSISVG